MLASKLEMDSESNKLGNSPVTTSSQLPFPDEVLEKVLSFIDSHKDRNSVSLVRKDWFNAERWTRSKVFIGNCYSVSPEIVARRFPRIKSITLKGKPRFADFNMLPRDWGANVHRWLLMFAKVYPSLEELRLKRMTVTDESLELLAKSLSCIKVLSLSSCDGFNENGLKAVAAHCRNLTELDIQDSVTADFGGGWLSCFPESFTSLEVLNFARLNSVVSCDDLEKLVRRCRSLRILKVNESISLDQLHRLLIHTPQLVELGTGSFQQELTNEQCEELDIIFGKYKNLQVLSGLWEGTFFNIRLLYGAIGGLTFLNLSDAILHSVHIADLLTRCHHLRRLWVNDTVQDKGLEAVGANCPLLEELRVFPADPFDEFHHDGVTELGFLEVSRGCPKLRYVLYFCQRMTNAAVVTIVQNCPNFTHFRLCIMTPCLPDHVSNEPMDEAFGAVVRTCTKLKRLSISGLLTDLAFEYIGKYAKNLESLSVAFAGTNDRGMECLLQGCPKLRKLEIRDCPFGNAALLSGRNKYETMRSMWMSGCNATMKGCRQLAQDVPRLNVEVISGVENNDDQVNVVYVYRSLAGSRQDAPPSVLTL